MAKKVTAQRLGRIRIERVWTPVMLDYECTVCTARQSYGVLMEFETQCLVSDALFGGQEQRIASITRYWRGSTRYLREMPCRKCGGYLQTAHQAEYWRARAREQHPVVY